MAERKSRHDASKPKGTNAEIDERVTEVYERLIRRESRASIVQFVAKKWGVNARQTDNYIARATELLKQQSAYDRNAELTMAVELMKHVIKKTLNVMDYQRTIAAQREINQLLGLYAPEKQETTIRVIDMPAVEADIIRQIEAGELDRAQVIEIVEDESLAEQLFAGAQNRISAGKA